MWIRRGKTTGTVVCIASENKNLHQSYGEALGLTEDYEDIEADFTGRIGDLLNGKIVTEKPENYPVYVPTEEEVREQKISAEMRKIAEDSLIAKGEL